MDDALGTLYQMWLRPCEITERWIAVQSERGFTPDNFDEFRECFEEAKAIVKLSDQVAGQIEEMRDQAIEDYHWPTLL